MAIVFQSCFLPETDGFGGRGNSVLFPEEPLNFGTMLFEFVSF